MMKRTYFIFIFILLFILKAQYKADGYDYVDGKKFDEFEISQYDGISQPSVSPTNSARLYYDSTADKLKISENGGSYYNLSISSSLSNNYIPKWNGSTLTNSIIYDNNNVGIGNTAPQGILDVGTTPGKGLIVLTNGNTGIGTTNPITKLDVIGNEYISGNLGIGTTAVSTYKLNISGNLNATTGFVSTLGIGTTSPVKTLDVVGTTTLSGNVGIGTTNTSTYALNVNGDANVSGDLYVTDVFVTNIAGESYVLGNFGIGNSAPNMRLRIGTSPGQALLGVTNAGNVGIGTTTPIKTLDVVGTGTFSGNVGIGTTATSTYNLNVNGTANATTLTESTNAVPNSTDNLSFFAATTSAQLAGVISDETGSGNLVYNTAPTFITSITDPLIIGGTATTSTLTLRSTSGVGTTGADIIFQTGNNGATEVMRILNNGNVGIKMSSPLGLLQVGSSPNPPLIVTTANVGIATTAPIERLDINGNIRATTGLYSTLAIGITTSKGMLHVGNTLASPGLIILSNNFVGIGTTNPQSSLHIVNGAVHAVSPTQVGVQISGGGDGNPAIELTANNGTPYIDFQNDIAGTDFDMRLRLISDDVLSVEGGDLAIGAITSGNVGIGTTSPNQRLQVTGNISATTGIYSNLFTSGNVGIGTSTPANVRLAVIGGNVGIGLSTTSQALEVSGNIKGTTGMFSTLSVGVTNIAAMLNVGNTAGSPGLSVNSANNVGIGKTSPSTKLDILGDLASETSGAQRIRLMGYSPSLELLDKDNTQNWFLGLDDDTNDIFAIGEGYGPGQVGGGGGAIHFVIDTNGNIGIGTTNPVALMQIGNSPTPPLFVTSGGNVGIGTTSPANKLTVADGRIGIGVLGVSSANTFLTLYPQTSGQSIYHIWNENASDLKIGRGALGAEAADVTLKGGNVGIGTTSPGQALDVSGSAVVRTSLGVGSTMLSTTPALFVMKNSNSGSFTGALGGNTIAVFQNSDPGRVNADVNFITTDTGTLNMYFAGTSTTYSAQNWMKVNNSANTIRFGTANGDNRLFIGSDGNVGIGTSNPLTLLQVGTAPAPGLNVTVAGLVGIGTSNPDALLTLGSANKEGYIRLRGASINEGNIYHDTTYAIHMDTNGNTLPIKIDGSYVSFGSNVGIGITNPPAKMVIVGSSTAPAQCLYLKDNTLIHKVGTTCVQMVLTISGTTAVYSGLQVTCP